MIAYFVEILRQPLTFAWLVVTGGASAAAYFLPSDALTNATRAWLGATIALLLTLLGVLARGYGLYQRTSDPVRVRDVVEGTHHNRGKLIVILDRAPWVEFNQIVTLLDISQEVRTPVCLLRVEAFTSRKFPQCVVLRLLSDEDIGKFLTEKTRRGSLRAVPSVLTSYLEG